jgi:biopolymer transport protein ExbD
MRIRVHPKRRRLDRITLNLASMIDVTFLMLIYFLVTTVMARNEDRLTPNLQTRQEDSAGQASDFQPQVVEVVRVAGTPIYRIGGRSVADRQALRAALRQLPKSEGVFINVADQIPVEFAIAAVQVARDAGFDQVTYVPVQ